MAKDTSVRPPEYYSTILLYNKGLIYNGDDSIPFGYIYEVKAYKARSKRKSRLGRNIYTRQEYVCYVYAHNEYEAYILMLDYGYEDITVIND